MCVVQCPRERFDELNDSLEDYIDRIAERAVELGGVADSTQRVVATWSHVLCSPDALCRNHAQTIATAAASFSELVWETADKSNELGDVASAHMFSAISQDINEWHARLTAF